MIIVVLVSALAGVLGALYIARPYLRASERRTRLAALAVAGLVAAGALGAYVVNGEPDTPGQPYSLLAERLRAADPADLTAPEQEERLRDAVRRNARDDEALALLGRLLARTGRELEAIAMFERALRINEDPRTLSELGQALTVLNEGVVTPEAERAFAAAAEADPALPEPAFFLGAAAYERGDRIEAARRWSGIITRLEPGNPFRAAIAARAADLLSRPSAGPAAGEPAPFANEGAADMEAMVEAMVGRLESRLADEPEDLSGWLTLARARMMQDRPEAARTALETAREAFQDDPGAHVLIGALHNAFGFEESDT